MSYNLRIDYGLYKGRPTLAIVMGLFSPPHISTPNVNETISSISHVGTFGTSTLPFSYVATHSMSATLSSPFGSSSFTYGMPTVSMPNIPMNSCTLFPNPTTIFGGYSIPF